MEQAALAELMGVTKFTIRNWENGRSRPPDSKCAVIIRFLGYSPFGEPVDLGGHLLEFRRRHGLTTRAAAAAAKVDPSSWVSWENGEHLPYRVGRKKLEELIKNLPG